MPRLSALLICVLFSLTLSHTYAADAPPKHKAVVAGNLTINPHDIIAIYRPIEQQAVAVFIGRPGQGIQAIVFKDVREAAAVFNDLWNNEEITKNPGDSDTRPLTRMVPKDAERKSATLILNVDRVLAFTWDSSHRAVRVYLDKPLLSPLVDPNTGDEHDSLEIQNVRDDSESIMAAYKLCLISK
jgi:hypothetical protein